MIVGLAGLAKKVSAINVAFSAEIDTLIPGLKDFGMTVPISEITLLGFCRLPRLAKYKALSEFFASMER